MAVRDSFHAARRQLEDHARWLRGDVKTHEGPPHGRVAFLDVELEWGLLDTADDRRIYFHHNAVLGGIESLAIGDEVRYREHRGAEGPQASTVERLGEHGHHSMPAA